MNQEKTEKGIFILCGALGVIFLAVFVLFLARTGQNGDRPANTPELAETLVAAESGENLTSAGNTVQGQTVQEGAAQNISGENGQNAETAEQAGSGADASGQDASEGAPVVFTGNASQSTEGDWLFVEGNRIVDADGKPVWLTGINWFGYNTGTNCFDGLWTCDLNNSIKAIADHGFNILRIPISSQLLLQWKNGEYPAANFNQATNSYLVGMNSLEIFDYVLELCEQNGIKVLLDTHCAMTNAAGHTVNLWVDGEIDEADFIEAWVWVAERYKDNDTIIAFDLKNEPHGKPYEQNRAIWNDSADPCNWKYVAEKTAAQILAVNPNVLILIEGLEIYPVDIAANGDYHSTNEDDYYFNWWGGNLRGVRDYPVDLGEFNNKLVYSPHDYGPTVYQQPWFYEGYDYDSLMEDCWRDNWFYIYEDGIAPLLIGEWGGFMREPNLTWMTHLRTLIGKYRLHYTFWCFNANSGDTGGLVLDDFTTWDEEKYAFVKEVLWQQDGKFVGLDHEIPLGANGITLTEAAYEDW